ncbi:putative receptor protein kinase ZmPK1 isoform X1 [Mangifera indica]|uniref:putative receptor protein kinase ZmPK1 isoform X1 n=1 Tax=Mangifera indica TaxID=29780 RepID=UPI001CFBD809|nr:putative receptor protein kinase ZmPK1 isoform X1 [Mangifera indica]
MTHRALIFPKFPTLLSVPLIFLISFESSYSQSLLQKGSSLLVEDSSHVYLTSPDKTFTCGFYSLGENAHWFSIWFTNAKDSTVVWMANPERPVNGKGSKVSLQHNGDMVLKDVDGSVIWTTNTPTTGADKAELLESGNLVLKDTDGNILWQSFDFPTDTLLPNQPFTKRKKLVCRSGPGAFATGYFSLHFNDENVLSLIYDAPDISGVYWPDPDKDVLKIGRTKYNSSAVAVLDERGNFLSSDRLQFSALDMGFGIKRRLTIDHDGNLRLYSLNNLTGHWMVSWIALLQQCHVHGVCGKNGICAYALDKPKCSCPPGFEVTEPGNWSKGCKPKFNRSLTTNSKQVNFITLPSVNFWGFDLNFIQSSTKDDCMKLCLDDFRCEAYTYRLTEEGRCNTKSALFNGHSSPNVRTTTYIKVPGNFQPSGVTSSTDIKQICKLRKSNITVESPVYHFPGESSHSVIWTCLYSFVFGLGAIELLVLGSGWWFLFRRHGVPSVVEDGYQALSSQFRSFSYSELKKATQKFKEELGRGAFGVVYKGVLADERAVAVKRLGDIYQGEEAFWAEVSIIGKIYHMNLVRMWGFCSEANHKLLVYEYIENLSLDKHLFSSGSFLGWKERFKVALGTAKALAYLHHECLEWVIHCDVKPENILLDSEFEPKISDFGLAMLSQRGKQTSGVSRIRGTKGYMAPEWTMNLPITSKVDVYSYGVVILEMVKGIRVSHLMVEEGDEEQEVELNRIVKTVKRKMQFGEDNWIEEMADQRLNGHFSRSQAAKLVEIGISCMEEDRNKRPTMESIVQALSECEAETEIHCVDNQ